MFEIVVNPAGASGYSAKLFQKIEPLFQGYSYRVHYSTLDCSITDIVKQLTSRQQDTDLIIIGGDGTMNQAINGIVDFSRTRIGFLSCGSGNDLARSLKLPKKMEDNIQQILQGKTRRTLDIGEVIYHHHTDEIIKENTESDGKIHHRFLISCGIGFDAACCQQAQISKMKKILNFFHLGKLIYLVIAFGLILKHETAEMTMEVDQHTETYKQLLFAVCMNEPYEGGGFMFCPHSDDTDGKLDLCIGDSLSRRAFFRIFPSAYSGKHLQYDGVYQRRGERVFIHTDHPLWVHTDGEVHTKSDSIEVCLRQEKIQFLQ